MSKKITDVENQIEYLKAIKTGGIALAVIIVVLWVMFMYSFFSWQIDWLL